MELHLNSLEDLHGNINVYYKGKLVGTGMVFTKYDIHEVAIAEPTVELSDREVEEVLTDLSTWDDPIIGINYDVIASHIDVVTGLREY